ncbi:MAG TPA: phosphotransferase [Patescibacteria group bacterium]
MANLNKHDVLFLSSNKYKSLAVLIEKSYDLKIDSVEFPSFISFTSRKAIIHTNKGIFFLKEKPQYSDDKLSREKSASFQKYASTKLDIVPKILTTVSGQDYILWKKRYFFLTEYKEGRTYNGSDSDVKAMLIALQKLNNCGKDFVSEKDISQNIIKKIESYEVASLVPLIEKYIKSDSEKETYQRILKLFEKLKSEYLEIPKSEYLMSHSDFIVFNLIFKNDKVLAINDFDNAKCLPKIHDLAEFLVSATLLNYNGSVTNMKLPVLLNPDKSKFQIITKSYANDFSLNKSDFKLLAVVAEIVWAWTLCLSILKEDYTISDLSPVISLLEKNYLSGLIRQNFELESF